MGGIELKIVLFVIYVISIYVYFPLNRRRSKFYWKSPIDYKIPLIPVFVVPYELYLIYHVLCLVLLWNTQFGIPFMLAFTVADFTAALFWFKFPNGVHRPHIKRRGMWFTMVKDLYTKYDKYDTNAFPSNHVYGAVISSYYMAQAFPNLWFLFFLIGISVVASTVLVKQHHFTDLIAGTIWAQASILFVANLLSVLKIG